METQDDVIEIRTLGVRLRKILVSRDNFNFELRDETKLFIYNFQELL
jgi:hypothetical protein